MCNLLEQAPPRRLNAGHRTGRQKGIRRVRGAAIRMFSIASLHVTILTMALNAYCRRATYRKNYHAESLLGSVESTFRDPPVPLTTGLSNSCSGINSLWNLRLVLCIFQRISHVSNPGNPPLDLLDIVSRLLEPYTHSHARHATW